MNGRPWQDSLDLFLEGRLKDDDLAGFMARVHSDADVCGALESASCTEAAFYDLSWGLSGGDAMQGPLEMADEATRAGLFSRPEWQSLIQAAFAAADRTGRVAAPPGRTVRFPKIVRYLAAACLILAAAGFLVWTQMSYTPQQPRIVATGRVLKDTVRSPFPGKNIDTVVTGITFDSVIVYSMRDAAKRPVQPAANDGILQLGDSTAILLEKNSSLEIRRQFDSAVTLDMGYGSAVFTVEKGRYRDFRIYTPGSEIAVTGTVFRVRAGKDTTVVSVKEGSVNTRRIGDTGFVAIPAGMSGYISAAGIVLAHGDSAATLLYKRNLLRDFLEENGVWENGRFIRTGLLSQKNSAPARELNE